jgi:hypothetical protein
MFIGWGCFIADRYLDKINYTDRTLIKQLELV